MENNKFEKEIKDMFNQHQPRLDHDDIWENIEPKLKKKKKRRFFFIWFFGLGLAALSYYAFQEMNNLSPSTAVHSTSDSQPNQQSNKQISEAQPGIRANDQLAEEISLQEEQFSKTSATKSADLNGKKSSRYNNRNTRNNMGFPQELSTEVNPNNSTLTTTENNLLTAAKENDDKPSTENTNISELEQNAGTNKTSTKGTTIDDVLTAEEAEDAVNSETNSAPADKTLEKRAKKKGVKKKRKRKRWNWNWNWNWNWDWNKKKKKKRKKDTRPVKTTPWEIQFQTAVAPALARKNLTEQTPSVEGSILLEKEKEAIEQLEAFSFNMGLHFQHKSSGFLIATGLEYRQINERFYYYSEEKESITRNGVIAEIENIDGAVIDTETGPKTVNVETTTEKRFYNNHRFVSLPIGVGKAWTNRQNGFKVLTGIDVNLTYRFKGAVFNQQLDPIKVSKNKNVGSYNEIFKSSAGMGLWVSGEYNRAINPRLSWLIAPKLQIPISSSMKSDYQLSQKHLLLQFDIGINYLLNPSKNVKAKMRK